MRTCIAHNNRLYFAVPEGEPVLYEEEAREENLRKRVEEDQKRGRNNVGEGVFVWFGSQ